MATKKVEASSTRRVNLHLTASAYDRLQVHSVLSRESPGAIVTRLVEEHLRSWRVQRNAARVDLKGRLEPEGDVNSDAEIVAA